MQKINDEYNAGVEAVKVSLGYSSNKATYEKAIKDAKSHYDGQKALYDSASTDLSEDAMKLRHAAEEAMNAKIKEAKANLDILESKFNAETEKFTQAKTAAIQDLEEKVAKEKIRLDHKAEQELRDLNNKLASAEADIHVAVRNERTKEEAFADLHHQDDIRAIREQKEIDAKVADDILKAKPREKRIAEYLKAKKIPKAIAAILLMLPMLPVFYLQFLYGKFIGNVIGAM